MKKTVAVFIAFFIVSMGVMVGWGFIDKQLKENVSPPASNPSSGQSATPTNSTSEQPSSPSSTSPAVQSYSIAELSKHNTQNDCWLAINGNVYNVTQYLDFHPGGSDLILMMCGKDATQAYNTQGGRGRGHSSRADTLLAQYIIGKLN